MTSTNEIRRAFLDYFEANSHQVVASSPLVPRNDPTLMFTAAGMVQFKNVFTGLEQRDYKRAVTSQKCVRAGGKHNDLDNVGYTARHHTFFEMLGNFSFGDYFKETAIELACNLITKEFGLPKERLLATVYSEDDEAFSLWKKIAGLPESRIIRISTSDNFWAMGDTGPCGPCSEIFFDHGEAIAGGPPGSPDEDGDRFVEIWNLVFMQYEKPDPNTRIDLPRPSIDTGMGLERISAVLQDTYDNYETDLFKALINASVEETGVSAKGEHRSGHRVIADHLRATGFLISDGVLPSNEGRGYVLRRIMRRAMRHAHLFGAKEPLLYKLVPTLVSEMGQAYPELVRAQSLITESLKLEEERFRRTLDRGLSLLDEAISGMSSGHTLKGETAFKLYDTYGFPLDLTQDALRAHNISVDTDGFNQAMERQKAEARAAWSGSGDAATEQIWFALSGSLPPTDFLGYETEEAEGVVVAAVKDGLLIATLSEGDEGVLVLNQSPFYGESGGQVGDKGWLSNDSSRFRVTDTQKRGDGLLAHYGVVEKGTIGEGVELRMQVASDRRAATRCNHSATHLLHASLRSVLGSHVAQKGSLVEANRFRFDFSHPKPVSQEELQQVEDLTNQVIYQNDQTTTQLMDIDDAMASGAIAMFGEKYGDEVRVLSMGQGLDGNERYSVELCGGTHVGRTGDIGLMVILSESAVAAGVRRIEAATGDVARRYLRDQDLRVRSAASALKVSPAQMLEKVSDLIDERRKLERALTEAKKQLATGGGAKGIPVKISEIGGVKVDARILNDIAAKELKGIVDEAKSGLGSGIAIVVGVGEDGRAGIVVGVTADLTDRFNAVDLVRVGSDALGGKGGGGRPDMAQAGGPNSALAEAAVEAIKSAIGS